MSEQQLKAGAQDVARIKQDELRRYHHLLRRQRLHQASLPETALGLEEYLERFGFSGNNAVALEVARKWLAYVDRHQAVPREGWTVYGAYGVGKTTLLQMVGRELVDRQVGLRFVNLPRLQRLICRDLRSGEMEDALWELAGYTVLILDEFGQDTPNFGEFSWINSFIAPLINERYEAQLPTLIGTVYDMDALGKRWGLQPGSRDNAMSALDRLKERNPWFVIKGDTRRDLSVSYLEEPLE